MCVHRTFSGPGLEAQVIYLAVHLLLRGFLFCVLGSGQCAMVVWDAGSRVDGATQGGGYRLCSCSTGLITPLKKERRLAHPSPHHECLLAYPCMTLRPLTGPPWGFHPTLCLIISDEQRCVLTWRAIQGDCVHVQACPGDGPPLLEESNEWSIKRRLNPNDAEFANSPLTLTTKPHTTHTSVHSTQPLNMADAENGGGNNNPPANPIGPLNAPADDDTDLTVNQDLEKYIAGKTKSIDRVKLPPDGESIPEGTMGALLRLARNVAMEQGMTIQIFLRVIRPIFAVRKDTNAFINDAARRVQSGELLSKTEILDQLASAFAPSETTEAASQALRMARKEPGQTYTAFFLTFLDMLHVVAGGEDPKLPAALWEVWKGMWLEGHDATERDQIKTAFLSRGGWKQASLTDIGQVLKLFDGDKTLPTTTTKTRRSFGLNLAEVDPEELQRRLMAIETNVAELKLTGRQLEEESRRRGDEMNRSLQEATRTMQERSGGPREPFKCYGCGSPEHGVYKCPRRKGPYQRKQTQVSEEELKKMMERMEKMEGEVATLKKENAKLKEGQKESKAKGFDPNGGTLPRGTA